jgi:hypothetical protein
VRIAGRSVQRAERAAHVYGERASGLYLDASDGRTLGQAFERADAIVLFPGGAPFAALECAIRAETPLVCATPFYLDARARSGLAERAWEASVPLVLHAGALPGLPGVLAEQLVRHHETLDEIRLVSSGPWASTPTARLDQETLAQQWKPDEPRSSPRRRSQWTFPDPLGRRLLRSAHTLDLQGFADAHQVERVTYLEPDSRLVARGVDLLLQRPRDETFVLVAEAFAEPGDPQACERITLGATDTAHAAAAVAGILTRAMLADHVPAGVLSPRDALNPGTLLAELGERGVSSS